jgi:hypothetical protein
MTARDASVRTRYNPANAIQNFQQKISVRLARLEQREIVR